VGKHVNEFSFVWHIIENTTDDEDESNVCNLARSVTEQEYSNGETAFMKASMKAQIEMVRLLLDLRADVSIKDKDKKIALSIVSYGGRHDAEVMLRKHIDSLNAKNRIQWNSPCSRMHSKRMSGN
jgi:ankyrin repeat protein